MRCRWIPKCQANYIWNVVTKKEKYRKLLYDQDIDLRLCWEYFDRTYKCYCVEPKYDGTKENYLYNLNNFQFSFREVDSSAEDNIVFTMKKDKEFSINCNGLDYVSDIWFCIAKAWF